MTDSEELISTLVYSELSERVIRVSEIKQGFNQTFRVSTDSADYFVKLGEALESGVREETDVIGFLDQNGVRAPSIVGAGEDGEVSYFIADWIMSDSTWELPESPPAGITKEAGRQLALTHEAGVDTRLEHSLEVRAGRRYRELLLEFADDIERYHPQVGSEIRRLATWGESPEAGSLVVCPLDFHQANVLANDGELQAVVDFERCYIGPPAWSYFTSARLFGLQGDTTYSEDFRKGYESVREVPEYKPEYGLGALAREVRASHMIWEDESERVSVYQEDLKRIERQLRR